MDQQINKLINIIKSASRGKRPYIIAIDGFGGSGKTTLAHTLVNNLNDVYVIHLDDFILKDNMNEPSWENGFDRKRLREQVLVPIHKGKRAKYQKLIWVSNELSDYQLVPPARYIVVEGISSLHPVIEKYYDYKIWVDTPINVAKARGKARDAGNENEKMWDLWAENDIKYRQQYRPNDSADFVIYG